MSWHNRFSAIGTIGGAEFVVERHEYKFGRRKVVDELPLRDDPEIKDMGARKDEFTLEMYTIGANYDIARDKLIAVLKREGSVLMRHPYFREMTVEVIDAREHESTNEGGIAKFSVTFIRKQPNPNQLPLVAEDVNQKVKALADEVMTESIDDFADNFSVLGQAADIVQGVTDELDSVMQSVEDVVGSVTGPIADLIRAPAEMAAAIAGAVNNIGIKLSEPGRALGIYKQMFGANGSGRAFQSSTASQRQQAASVDALRLFFRRAVISEAAKAAADSDFATRDDALGVLADLHSAIDNERSHIGAVDGAPINDQVYGALCDLAAATGNDLRVRGARLPELTTYTPEVILPALLISHQVYGDHKREAEIVARNRIQHPGFVPGGQALEVISG